MDEKRCSSVGTGTASLHSLWPSLAGASLLSALNLMCMWLTTEILKHQFRLSMFLVGRGLDFWWAQDDIDCVWGSAPEQGAVPLCLQTVWLPLLYIFIFPFSLL